VDNDCGLLAVGGCSWPAALQRCRVRVTDLNPGFGDRVQPVDHAERRPLEVGERGAGVAVRFVVAHLGPILCYRFGRNLPKKPNLVTFMIVIVKKLKIQYYSPQ
jgi:hypothetical protein